MLNLISERQRLTFRKSCWEGCIKIWQIEYFFWKIILINRGHKMFTFRSSMKRRRKLWRNCKTMKAGSSSRNRSWSFRPSLRSSGSRRRASRTPRPTSGTTWRSGTPRRRGSCSEPRPRPTVGPAWPTCGVTRVTGAGADPTRAPVTVPGPPAPPPTRPRPRGPGRPRTPGPRPTGTRRRRRAARLGTTGPPSSSGSCSCSLHPSFLLLLFYSKTNLWTHHHALSLDGSAFYEFLKNSI